MPRQHRNHASGLHGQSVRERMRNAVIAIACAILVFPTTAAAEVCDKIVGEHWRRGDGPAWSVALPEIEWAQVPLGAWAVVLGIPCVLALATFASRISLLAAIFLKWTGYAAVAMMVIFAFFFAHGIFFPEDIRFAALRESCISVRTDWRSVSIDVGVMALLVLFYVWMAFRMRRFERSVEARQRRLVAS